MIQAYESEEIQKIAAEGGSNHGGKTKNGRTHGGVGFSGFHRKETTSSLSGVLAGGAVRTGCELPQFVPSEGVTKLVECSRGESRENGKMNEISVPGKGELFWREVSQRSGGSR